MVVIQVLIEWIVSWLVQGREERSFGGYERGTKRLKPYPEDSLEVQRRLGRTDQIQPCKPCEGQGHAQCLAVGCGQMCETCHGTGRITCARCEGHGSVVVELRAA